MTDHASTLLRQFFHVVKEGGGRPAIIDDHETVSFAELGERVLSMAAQLADQGVAGQRVAMLVEQGAAWVEAFFGIVAAGGVVVPLSHLHPAPEQKWFVETSGARVLVVSQALAPQIESYRDGHQVLSVEAMRSGPPSQRAHVDACPAKDDDPALILYTSGTTGKPKGALIGHGNLAELARLVAEAWEWKPEDRLLHSLPLHHLHGLGIALFVSLLAGGATRMLRKFDAAQMWEEMGTCNVLMGVPTMHKKLLDTLDAADDSTSQRWTKHAGGLRLVTSGSAALPVTVSERWRELSGDSPLERFGMTEIGVGMSNPVRGPRKPGSCGKPLPGMQIRIVDEHGDDVPIDQPGEIWIKGPSVFLGYDHNPQATAAAFTEGWFRSGDTACWDDEGYCRILGRTSVDILKSGGYKLSALELEELLRDHPAVGDVAVVGIPDETWGEIAVACVAPQPGWERDIDEAELRAWAKQRVAAYKVPKRVLRWDDFPRNPVGKVVKPELKKLVQARLDAS